MPLVPVTIWFAVAGEAGKAAIAIDAANALKKTETME
jgi:hypothetical protein